MGYLWLSVGSNSGNRSSNFPFENNFVHKIVANSNAYQLMAEERGLAVDVEGFNVAMDQARERSRNAQNKVIFVGLYGYSS